MCFIQFRLLFLMCVILSYAKTTRLGNDSLTSDEVGLESSTPYVVIPPSTVVQDINKSDRSLNSLERKMGTASSTYPAVTSSYVPASDSTRQDANFPNRAKNGGRLFGDNSHHGSEEKDKMSVELAFVFPFLDVPLGSKRSVDGSRSTGSSSTGSSNDGAVTESGQLTSGVSKLMALDPKSIVQAFALSMGTVVLIPFITSFLTGTPSTSVRRSEDSLYRVLTQIDHKLQSYNIDASSCVCKAICSYVRTASKKMIDGKAGSSEQIIDGIARNSYVKSLVSGTSIAEAMEIGRRPGTTCIAAYPKCPFTVSAMSSFITTFISQMVETPS